MQNVIISVNPKAGRTSPMKRAEELQQCLTGKGFHTELLTNLDEVADKANTLHAAGLLRALVGAGGDGTAATLVNLTAPGVPLTLLPAGTANLLAKHYRIPSAPKKLAELIEHGKPFSFDAGVVRFQEKQRRVERLFLVMVSCGFDADVVCSVHKQREERYRSGHRKGAHISYFSYLSPIGKSLAAYRFPEIQMQSGDSSRTARWAFVFNVNRYGWGLPLAPFAKENDGKLDAVLFRGGTVFHGFFYTLLAQCFGSHRFLPSVTLQQGTKLTLTSQGTVPFQLDGDPGGILPIEIEVIPNRATFLRLGGQ